MFFHPANLALQPRKEPSADKRHSEQRALENYMLLENLARAGKKAWPV